MDKSKKIISKSMLKSVLEDFWFDKLEHDEYEITSQHAKELLTWNRIDLAFKLLYLDLKNTNEALAEEIYFHDIRSQTLGSFTEIGNEEKNTLDKYRADFESTFNSIQRKGFDCTTSYIPIASDGSILNGSHRVSSAIFLDKDIDCVNLKCDNFVADYKYFYDRNVPNSILDRAAVKFIEQASNIYLAFLWPSGKGFKSEAESKFSNVVYKKEVTLTPRGGFNLLLELYKHMDWIGNAKNDYQGIQKKLTECFPTFKPFNIIAFQAESLSDVRGVKEEIRNIYNIGYSSIHITDTKEEAIRISNLVYSDNGLHFLNYAHTLKYSSLNNKLDDFGKYLERNNINKKDVIIDGSVILSLYGIRKNLDIDYLCVDGPTITEASLEFETHDDELKYHEKGKANLIYDSKYYFQYLGFKFVSFSQLYEMKKRRNEKKDVNDCTMMEALIDNNRVANAYAHIKQTLLYVRIKTRRKFLTYSLFTFKKLGVYEPVRWFYRKIRGS